MKTQPASRREAISRGIALAAIVAAVGYSLAGPLTPPGGPVASSYKTLQEVEPRTAVNAANTPGSVTGLYRISSPGSYYLTGNVTGIAAKNGIEITASGVTLDLNGFDVAGVAGIGVLDGVTVIGSGLTSIAVINGSIRNWGGDGVDMISSGATNGRVEALRVSGNAGNGISLGIGGAASRCQVKSNTQHGIFATGPGTFTECTISNNNGNGIDCSSACVISNCSLYQNADGINSNAGCSITNSTLYGNNGRGIITGNGCLIAGCDVRASTFDGISVPTGCVVRDNVCDLNGNGSVGAGIHITGLENRIEGNNCTNADSGLTVDGSRNIIIKNTCAANSTNWAIAAGNAVAPIISAGINAAAISGNTYAGSLGSTDPNANFTY